MILPKHFISCDWGTSNFRLVLVETDTLNVVFEHQTNKGAKVLYNEYATQHKVDQRTYFSNYLLSQIKIFPKQYQSCLIVSSGMVTSTIGLKNLNYGSVPFDKNGSNFVSQKLQINYGLEMLLISGIRNSNGIMRGEETQAIGLEEHMNTFNDAVLLLPGTHSKHLIYSNGKFTDFESYMTGELFEIISQQSILSKSISKANKTEIIEHSFISGLQKGVMGLFAKSLFSIRAMDISNQSTKEENYYFLSGLIIGNELSYLEKTEKKVFLGCPYPLANFYKMALDYIIGKGNYVLFDDEIIKKATLIGQKKILQHYE